MYMKMSSEMNGYFCSDIDEVSMYKAACLHTIVSAIIGCEGHALPT